MRASSVTSRQASRRAERYIVRVVRLRPAKFVRDLPRLARETVGLTTPHRCVEDPAKHRLGLLPPQLASPEHRVQSRDSLDPHQRWSDKLKPPKPLEPDRIGRRSSGNARIDDELQRPSRDNATAATQLGAGVPSSSCCHSGERQRGIHLVPHLIERTRIDQLPALRSFGP